MSEAAEKARVIMAAGGCTYQVNELWGSFLRLVELQVLLERAVGVASDLFTIGEDHVEASMAASTTNWLRSDRRCRRLIICATLRPYVGSLTLGCSS